MLSAFIEEILLSVGITGQETIDLAGAGFQAAIAPAAIAPAAIAPG